MFFKAVCRNDVSRRRREAPRAAPETSGLRPRGAARRASRRHPLPSFMQIAVHVNSCFREGSRSSFSIPTHHLHVISSRPPRVILMTHQLSTQHHGDLKQAGYGNFVKEKSQHPTKYRLAILLSLFFSIHYAGHDTNTDAINMVQHRRHGRLLEVCRSQVNWQVVMGVRPRRRLEGEVVDGCKRCRASAEGQIR
ncbi:hypothetical protein BV25DRAFT_1062856 [Artomyces pyxidatus]|uniref:Uncharacterized protein n=1 Tax=Artomyces pyxidatus TaxID=48021 RepID=A0ACB8SUL0_9AGAM|nr:hypothetical protein BV25DRAFT_1062856 [Artomyces pyxidatus]